MGDPNLSAGDQRVQRSLSELISAGDPDPTAGFREAHVGKVRSYCVEVCAGTRVPEAVEAAFVDFVARVRAADSSDDRLEELLLHATRSAAAGRFEIWRPLAVVEESGPGIKRDCAAIPELLAAAANGELRAGESAIRQHVEGCQTCATTAQRMQQAEQAFAQAPAVPS